MALARFGIINGERLPSEGIVGFSPRPSTLDTFSLKALRQFGFLGIAQKIIKRQELSVGDIEHLIVHAGFPVLLKLLSFSSRKQGKISIAPAVVLPVGHWLKFGFSSKEVIDQASIFLKSIQQNQIQVAFDEIDLNNLDGNFAEIVINISKSRRGLILEGPSIDKIVDTVRDAHFDKRERLENILKTLRDCGFKRLRASSKTEFLHLTKKLGFQNSLITPVDKFSSDHMLAQELHHLCEITSFEDLVDSWTPGVLGETNDWRRAAASDFQLLRVMAIGSLVLQSVPTIRASALYLSQATMHYASYFGANDLGFRAVDQSPQLNLKFPLNTDLKKVSES
ncbi:MAG: hypothetical protein SGJ02_07280 [bacterium]|nr:hypothetical protein [bacterium]